MSTNLSGRAKAVTAYSYDDFPVPAGGIDLRGDGSRPLDASMRAAGKLRLPATQFAGYGDVAGHSDLRSALGAVFGVDSSHVIVTAGGSEALLLALLCTTEHSDRILLPRPSFPGHTQLANLVGVRAVHYPVPGPVPSADGAAATLVCSPHNPTGVVTVREHVTRNEHGWLIWDRCHAPFGAPSPGRRPLDDREVVVFSLSKMLRMPGVRIGCLISLDSAFIATATAAKTHLSMSASVPAQRLAHAVLTDPMTVLEVIERWGRLAEVRTSMTKAIEATGAFTVEAATAGTHLLVHTADRRGDAWARLRDGGLAGLPGIVFHAPIASARLCVSQPDDIIDLAMARLETW